MNLILLKGLVTIQRKIIIIQKLDFLLFMERLPEVVKGINGKDINTNEIPLNETTIKELRKIY